MRLPAVAVVGLPNVGKSTLFNRLCGAPLALVDPQPGVTRDRNEAETEWRGRRFLLIDTGGLISPPGDLLEGAIREQVQRAMEEADVILFVVDGRAGLSPLEGDLARELRRAGKPLLLVVNKVDGPREAAAAADFASLGLGEAAEVSSLHGRGSGELLDQIVAALPAGPALAAEEPAALRIAVVGRPNVGKSSFINRLLGEERLIVSEVSGTTRDAIDTSLTYSGRRLILVDTAGLRRRSRIGARLEQSATRRAIRALARADVGVVMFDPTQEIGRQDVRIASLAAEKGKGVILAVTKWDLVAKEARDTEGWELRLRELAPHLDYAPIVFVSSRTGLRVRRVLDLAVAIGQARSRRVPTPQVNRALAAAMAGHQPPSRGVRMARIYYASQVGTSPPLFVLFVNDPALIPPSYLRYLERHFRQAFAFEGVPLVLSLRRRTSRRPRAVLTEEHG